MEKTYKVLKRFGDYKRGEIFDPKSDGYEGNDDDIATAITDGFISEITAPSADGVTKVTVTYNGGERIFSEEIHGDGFLELAKEFAETNEGTIA